MKRSVLFLFFAIILTLVKAQQNQVLPPLTIDAEMALPNSNFLDIKERTLNYLQQVTDSAERRKFKNFYRWDWFWRDRICDGSDCDEGNFSYVNREMAKYISSSNASCFHQGNDDPSAWKSIGPNKQPNPIANQNMGLITSIFVNPNDNNIVYAGSNSGGLFKTNNALSPNPTWEFLTDAAPIAAMGIQSIAVGNNGLTIYVATGTIAMNRGGYGIGVLFSMDGGQTWEQTEIRYSDTQLNLYYDYAIHKLLINPTDDTKFYAINTNKLFKADLYGLSVDEKNIPSLETNLMLRSMEYVPGNFNNIYISGKEIWRYNSITDNFTRLDNLPSFILPTPPSGYPFIEKSIKLSAVNDGIYALVHYSFYKLVGNNKEFSGVVNVQIKKYDTTVNDWVYNADCNSNILNSVFVVSKDNEDIIYTESTGRTVSKSINRGNNFTTISNYNQPFNGVYTHCDIRALYITNNPDSRLFVGNDGGIMYLDNADELSTNPTSINWKNINGTDLNITQFWGFDINEKDAYHILGGTQDNGTMAFINNTWNVNVIGDAYRPAINQQNGNFAIVPTNDNPCIRYTNNGGLSWLGSYCSFNDEKYLQDRPLIRDEQNFFYVGYQNVYKSADPTQGWTKISDFISGGCPVDNNNVLRAIAVAPSNNNIIFAAFQGAHWTSNTSVIDACPNRRLFYTTNGQSQNPLWNYIPLQLYDASGTTVIGQALDGAGISDIIVHPTNPNKIWVAMTDFIGHGTTSCGKNRVLEGTFNGTTWIFRDVSSGLPRFLVLRLAYLKGSNDVLFAGTDVGLFYYRPYISDPIKWHPFNKNMPKGIVNEIRINQCSGKIYAGVYGRGMWESAIPENLFTTESITTSQTWIGTIEKHTSISVEPGATLTITGILNMANNKYIIVKPGAHLVVNGGTITNGCGLMWDGIQVWGNPNANQSPALQGRITINNATITNARVAVTLSKKGDCCGYNGGYIIASNSSFINNFKSIEFMKYHRPLLPNGVEPNNLSFVTNCTFTSNDYLRDPNWLWPDGTRRTHDAHITLWDVKGATFRGNSFSNTLTNLPFNKRGEGIRSIDATYRVESTCLSYDQYGCTGVPNTFTNLFIGIKESATPGKISQLTCSRSVFNDVEKAIIIENTTGSRIVLNTFNHSYNPPPPSDPFAAKRSIFAVYANSSTALQVEQNTINFPQNLHKGIIVRNSRELGASVYRNTLHGAATRVQAEADNSMALIDCNDFYDKLQNRQQDIALTSGYLIDQGTCQNLINFPTNPEANRFYGYCDNNLLQLAKNANVPGYIYSSYSNPIYFPSVNCVSNSITPNGCGNITVPHDQACPSNLSSIKTIHQHKELANDYFAMQQQIKILLEAGNSPALYHSLQHDAPGIAKNNLLQASPYLSEQLLLAIVARGLPAGILKEILSANSPLPAAVLDALQQINLPNGVRSQIMALQNGISPYTQVIKTIEFYEASARQNIAEVIRQYLDSNDVRSAKVYLEQFEAPEYVCAYVPVAIDARDTVSASLALEKIEIIADSAVAANPADPRAIHLKGFCEFYRMVAQIEKRPNGYFDLDASEIEFIYLLAQDNSAVGARARAVYTLVSGEQLIAEPEELEENPSLRIQTPDDENVAQNPQTIRVYPNPSTGNVNIELTTEQQIEAIHIIDISGKKVFEQKSNGTMQETLSLSLSAEGLYLLQVQYSNGTYETKKIHIVK